MQEDLKLLIVEDDEATNYIYAYTLRKIGFQGQFETVENGEQAIDFILGSADIPGKQRFKPDIIFLDINMPRMNGFEFLEELKKGTNDIPKIYMLTNSLNPEDRNLANTHKEIKEFLGKPVNEDTLKRVLAAQ